MQQIIDLLNAQLDELASFSPSSDLRDVSISNWSVGQQIEHTLIAISGMILALRKEHPGSGTREPNLYRDTVMETKTFPRGAIQAPDISLPSESPDSVFITRLINKTRSRLGNPLEIDSKSTLIHPIMDVMYRDEALEFMTIHTAHHLAIIREIVAASSPESLNK
jgi:hypothetical protein